MTANEAMEILLQIEEKKKEEVFTEDTLVVVLARAGSPNPTIKAGYVKDNHSCLLRLFLPQLFWPFREFLGGLWMLEQRRSL